MIKYIIPLSIGLLLMIKPKSLHRSTSQTGINHLKFVEGEKLAVYLDAADNPTVGVGHKILPSDNLTLGQKITQQQSDTLLKQDLTQAEKAVNSFVTAPLNQSQFDALVSFVFNIGADRFRRSTLVNRLNDYDYQGALAEFSRWKYITVDGEKIESAGLINRRAHEQNLFNA